ncbi:MAG: peptidylprolyl isomerase [Acidimicrobiales bacterium]
MKRQLAGAAVGLLIASGALASACNVTPTAATANGTTISTGSLNSQLRTLESTQYGACLLQLENPQLTSASGQGAGGPGTYTTAFAGAVLESQVGQLLAEQYAVSRGLTVSSSDLSTARSDFAETLDGEISAAVQQSTSSGSTSFCESPDGSSLTGDQLLTGLPRSVSDAQVLNQAYDEKLLADGADLSADAILDYYVANKPEFTVDCVSRIVTSSEGAANQIVTELKAGAPFATVAKSSSIDTQTAANGGSLGCNYTQAGVEQDLEQQNVIPGQPLAPVQNSGTGQWFIYEVTSQTVEPLSAVESVVRRELLQATANVDRVSKEIIAFAHGSNVSVDPQYGTWDRTTIVPPVAPPPQYLLAAVTGSPSSTTEPPLTVGSGTGN